MVSTTACFCTVKKTLVPLCNDILMAHHQCCLTLQLLLWFDNDFTCKPIKNFIIKRLKKRSIESDPYIHYQKSTFLKITELIANRALMQKQTVSRTALIYLYK